MRLVTDPAMGSARLTSGGICLQELEYIELSDGNCLWIDPARSGSIAALDVLDHSEGGGIYALVALLGEDAAERVAAALGEPEPRDVEVEIAPGPELGVLGRAAQLSWLERFGVLPLDRSLLRLERAVLLAEAGYLGLEDAALELIESELPALERHAGNVTEGREGAAAESVVRSAAAVALRWVPLTEAQRNAFERLEAAEPTTAPPASAPPAAGAKGFGTHLGQVRPLFRPAQFAGFALTAGGAAACVSVRGHATAAVSPLTGTASVDWLQVPRGLLDHSEDTIWWTLGGGELTVVAAAAPGLDGQSLRHAAEWLSFRVVDDDGRALAADVLTAAPNGLFTGSCAISDLDGVAAALARGGLDIFDERLRKAARPAEFRAWARFRREVSRWREIARAAVAAGGGETRAQIHALEGTALAAVRAAAQGLPGRETHRHVTRLLDLVDAEPPVLSAAELARAGR